MHGLKCASRTLKHGPVFKKHTEDHALACLKYATIATFDLAWSTAMDGEISAWPGWSLIGWCLCKPCLSESDIKLSMPSLGSSCYSNIS